MEHCIPSPPLQNVDFVENILSFYSSIERRTRRWYPELKLVTTKKRKKTTSKMISARFEKYYRAGEPLFTRAALLDIATQISSGQPFIHLDDFHGLSRTQQISRVPERLTSGYVYKQSCHCIGFTRPDGHQRTNEVTRKFAANDWRICIDYRGYENLTNPMGPYDESDIVKEPDYNPISLSYYRPYGDTSGANSMDQIRANFNTHGHTWLASQECKDIVQPLLSKSAPKIRKIVAFALGSMA